MTYKHSIPLHMQMQSIDTKVIYTVVKEKEFFIMWLLQWKLKLMCVTCKLSLSLSLTQHALC